MSSPKGTHASTACNQCRQSRRKCNQEVPCSNCDKADKECVYDTLRNGRRKAVRQAKRDDLELRAKILEKIFITIREAPEKESQQITKLIRNGPTLEDIIGYVDHVEGMPVEESAQRVIEWLIEEDAEKWAAPRSDEGVIGAENMLNEEEQRTTTKPIDIPMGGTSSSPAYQEYPS